MSFSDYSEFLDELKNALEEEDTDKVDSLLHYVNSGNLDEDEVDDLEDIISEATLYLELGDDDYRETALKFIAEKEE